jgi:hypothetical protein
MPENLAITITGSLLQEWMEVFGTDTVPIDPPIPVAIEQTDGSRSGAFVVAFEKLAQEQQQRVVKHLADKHGLAISEVKEVLGRDGLAVPAEHCVMQRVTKSQIDMIRHGFRENFMPRHPEADEIVEAFTIAREIICFRLGHEWWTRNVFDELGSNAERMRYLRPSLGGEKERLESQDRVIDLADSLFLLQDCEGFDLKIRDLRKVSPTRPHVALEDAAIELQVAKTLVKSGHDVRFVAPSRTKSQDYDLQVNFKERISLNTEIKCRREDTAANVSSLRRIMNRAARDIVLNYVLDWQPSRCN